MKKIFAILLSLALVVSLGVLTAAPVAATAMPSVSPASGTYNMDTGVDVTTTIKWGDAVSLDSVTDNEGNSLTEGVSDDYVVYGSAPTDAMLVITQSYLDSVLTYVGDSITLILVFDVGIATFTITATGTSPAVSPTSGTWVYGSTDAVTTTIIWGPATDVVSVGTGWAEGTEWDHFGDLLVIYATDLLNVLDGVGDYVTLPVVFDAGYTVFTIVATGDDPTISPTSTSWVLGSDDVVTTTITFNSATSLNDIDDSDGYTLVVGDGNDYIVFGTLLVILPDYLDTVLTSADDSIVLTLTFDLGTVLFTISATGLDVPSISPETATWELGNCDEGVSTTITWADADTIVSVIDRTIATIPPYGGVPLIYGIDYTISGNTLTLVPCMDSGNRTISYWDGLECQLDGDVHQTRIIEITFNDDDNTAVEFVVSSGGFTPPSLSGTALAYDLDLADDPTYVYVGALITWGSATGIDYISQLDPDTGLPACNLTSPANYIVAYNAAYGGWLVLFLKSTFLNTLLYDPPTPPEYWPYCAAALTEIGDEAKVVIHWEPMNDNCGSGGEGTAYDDKFPATIVTITATGTSASMSPSSGEFNIDDPGNVTVEVDWGPHAENIDAITTGFDTLDEGIDYNFEAFVDEDTTSTLTIYASYLEDELVNVGDSIVLDVDFDTGEDGKLTITAIGTPLCFIATAAGADAPQLDILREFRDVVMRPNRLGAELISLYYNTSPPIAEFISQSGALKAAVKLGLIDPIAAILNLSHGLWS